MITGHPTRQILPNLPKKKPTRPDQVKGRVRQKYLTRNSKKPDSTQKLHTKLQANLTQPKSDPTRPCHGPGMGQHFLTRNPK